MSRPSPLYAARNRERLPFPGTAVGAEITRLVVRQLTLPGVMLTVSNKPADGAGPIQVASTNSINMEDGPTR